MLNHHHMTLRLGFIYPSRPYMKVNGLHIAVVCLKKESLLPIIRKLDQSKDYFFLLISHKIDLLEVRKYLP